MVANGANYKYIVGEMTPYTSFVDAHKNLYCIHVKKWVMTSYNKEESFFVDDWRRYSVSHSQGFHPSMKEEEVDVKWRWPLALLFHSRMQECTYDVETMRSMHTVAQCRKREPFHLDLETWTHIAINFEYRKLLSIEHQSSMYWTGTYVLNHHQLARIISN